MLNVDMVELGGRISLFAGLAVMSFLLYEEIRDNGSAAEKWFAAVVGFIGGAAFMFLSWLLLPLLAATFFWMVFL